MIYFQFSRTYRRPSSLEARLRLFYRIFLELGFFFSPSLTCEANSYLAGKPIAQVRYYGNGNPHGPYPITIYWALPLDAFYQQLCGAY